MSSLIQWKGSAENDDETKSEHSTLTLFFTAIAKKKPKNLFQSMFVQLMHFHRTDLHFILNWKIHDANYSSLELWSCELSKDFVSINFTIMLMKATFSHFLLPENQWNPDWNSLHSDLKRYESKIKFELNQS